MLGGVLLIVAGLALVSAAPLPNPLDVVRHSLAVGFIARLLCGVAPRMIPGFSGGRIATPCLVPATLWLGNAVALLRAGSLLPVLGAPGATLETIAFGLSGPLGLALAICPVANLWPALWPSDRGTWA